jgi:hypothetical protein
MRTALAVLALAAIAAAPASPVTSLAGRYSKHFKNGDVGGNVYWSDDVIEIVPVDASHAYFRADLQFYNGHVCGISGIARAVGSTLVYAEKQPSPGETTSCRLIISAKGKALLLDDGGNSCQAHCGARGSLNKFDFVPFASRRPITYMAKLKGSSQYNDAIADWKSGKVE